MPASEERGSPGAPRVSVVMPAYNAAPYIGEAIESALQQSLEDIELIVVDDCSTDGTADIVSDHARKERRLRMLSTPRNTGGPAAARNIGIRHARGEYISFLDADDKDRPEKLRRILDVFARYPDTDAVFCDTIPLTANGASEGPASLAKGRFTDRAGAYLERLDEKVYQCREDYVGCMARGVVGISTQGIVIGRRALDRLRTWFPEDRAMGEDIDLWFRIAESCNLKFLDEPLAYYRHNPASLTSSRYGEMLEDCSVFHEQNLERLGPRLTTEETEAYRGHIAGIFFRLGYHHAYDPRLSRRYFLRALGYRRDPKTVASVIKTLLPFYSRRFQKQKTT